MRSSHGWRCVRLCIRRGGFAITCVVFAMQKTRGFVVAEQVTQPGSFQVGPVDGNCLEAWQAFGPAQAVKNAHDQGNRDLFRAPLSNNVTGRLSPAPEG